MRPSVNSLSQVLDARPDFPGCCLLFSLIFLEVSLWFGLILLEVSLWFGLISRVLLWFGLISRVVAMVWSDFPGVAMVQPGFPSCRRAVLYLTTLSGPIRQ